MIKTSAAIFNFIRDEIAFESYVGSLRGARGTLWSGAGNAVDQSSLLVALLRASGVPAQYARGTLAETEAAGLITSMFPASLSSVGLIPQDALLSDPASDPGLLDEVRDHFWTQFDAGSGFQDADPNFAHAVIGDSFTTLETIVVEVPDQLRHKVTVRLERELAIPAISAFSGGSPLTYETVLDETFASVELVGRPLTLGHFVANDTIVTPVSTSVINAYAPYLAIGDEDLPIDQTELIRGKDYQEFITSFPLGTQLLTGLFVDTDLTAPGSQPETHRRTLMDRIGFEIRQIGGVPNILVGEDSFPAVTEFDAFTINVFPGLGNPNRSDALPNQVQSTLAGLADASFGSPATTRHLERVAIQGFTRMYAGILQDTTDIHTARLAESSLVKAYADSPPTRDHDGAIRSRREWLWQSAFRNRSIE